MRILQSLTWILVAIAAGYILILLFMYLMQTQMVYHPQSEIVATPSNAGLDYDEIRFETEDGLNLHGWFIPADTGSITVLYFHGNAGNISGRLETIQLLHRMNINVFIFDYRGYGKSEGSPGEEGTYRDASAAWNYLTKDRNVKRNRIVVMGRSLGGTIASWLAAREDPAAAVIESTFISAGELGADIYPWLPVHRMLKFNYNTLKNIKKLDIPLFMAHSRDDEIVPFHHGRTLFEAANEPKVFVELKGSHGSGFWETGTRYRNSLQQFLEKYTSYNQ